MEDDCLRRQGACGAVGNVAGSKKPFGLFPPVDVSVEQAADIHAFVGRLAENQPAIERGWKDEKPHAFQSTVFVVRHRTHFREFGQLLERFKCGIQKIAGSPLVVCSDEIPGGNQVLVDLFRCLPTHGFRLP